MKKTQRALAVVASLTLSLLASSCGGDTKTATETTAESAASETTKAETTAAPTTEAAPAETAGAYPHTFSNCGLDVTVDAAPERIVIMNSAPVTMLDSLGLMDRVTHRAGKYPEAYYSDELNAKIAKIPALTSQTDSSGHLVISLETVLETEPDIVFASESETISRKALADAGITLFTNPSFCKGHGEGEAAVEYETPLAKYSNIYDTINTYGGIFDKRDEAAAAVAALEKRVAEVADAAVMPAGTKAATLYVESDGGQLWAYGPKSMSHPQMESLGMTNVFSDLKERVVEVSIEELIDRNPDVLILLHSDPENSDADILKMVKAVPGVDKVAAIEKNQAYPHLFNFSEPGTPLVIEGLITLAERMKAN